LDEHGGTELLLQKLDEIAAYNTNNHLPLMWRFYSANRKVLFSLVRSLDILSTSEDALRIVKHQIQRIPNRDIGYGILRYLTSDIQVAEKLRSLPQPEVAFNYFGQVDFSQASLFQFAPESPETIRQKQGNRPHLLDVIGVISEDRLEMDFIYSQNVQLQSTIESLAKYFIKLFWC
jgi:non-ribosomal peptide synthase protein (TIGR01720 family)